MNSLRIELNICMKQIVTRQDSEVLEKYFYYVFALIVSKVTAAGHWSGTI